MSRAKDPYDSLKWEPYQKLTGEVDDTHVQDYSELGSQVLHDIHRFSNKCVPYIYHIMTFIFFIALLITGLSRLFAR